ncbi:ABC transporter permease [Aquabacterium sp.]|uniref:ABC transporter permease n=1 Tax=Aquabacterium sp. TaxID=1872578 RepID=UPI003782EFAC
MSTSRWRWPTREAFARFWGDLQLAARNLLRNRRRSASTLFALAIGLTAILLFGGFKANIRYSMITTHVRAGGHLQVQHRDFYLYGTGNPSVYGIPRYAELVEAIKRDPQLAPMVAVVTPRLQLGGVAGNFDAGVSSTVLGVAYVPEDVNRMRAWNEFSVTLADHPFRLEGAASDAAVIGLGVARVLQLCGRLQVANCPQPQSAEPAPTGPAKAVPSDIAALAGLGAPASSGAGPAGAARIELLSSSGRGAPNVAALSVVAAEDQGIKELDEVTVILQLPFAQRLVYGRNEPRVTAIMVQLKQTADMEAAQRRLETLLSERPSGGPPLAVRTFQELNPFYGQAVRLFDVIFGFIFALIGGIVLFTVSNTMNAAVVERTVEIGTLRAIGLRRGSLQRLFVLEGCLIGFCGAVTGIVAGLAIGWLVNHAGITWQPPASSDVIPLHLKIAGENLTLFGTAFGLMIVAMVSAWWPSYRAARLNVVEALRHA